MVGREHREFTSSADRLGNGDAAARLPRLALCQFVAVACAVGACQSGRSTAGPSRHDPDTPVVKAEVTPIAEAPEDSGVTTRAEARASAAAKRDDGRPDWWFREVSREGGRVKVCAEALAPSMVEARRAALDAARTKARKAIGIEGAGAIPGEEVVYAWAWPLPHASVGSVRYAGYVMLDGRDAP